MIGRGAFLHIAGTEHWVGPARLGVGEGAVLREPKPGEVKLFHWKVGRFVKLLVRMEDVNRVFRSQLLILNCCQFQAVEVWFCWRAFFLGVLGESLTTEMFLAIPALVDHWLLDQLEVILQLPDE